MNIKEESLSDTEEYQEIRTYVAGNVTIKREEYGDSFLPKVLSPQISIKKEVKEEIIVQDVTTYVEGEHVNIKTENYRNNLQNISSTQAPTEVKEEPIFATSDQDVDNMSNNEDIKEEDDITIEPVILQKRIRVVYGN